ncbi:LysE/ArgO family amino acid transporter [Salipiger mangrovisoli]|uniref:Amino acid transporter n=1 Tax=Salipiger mangrovisoli TaxID=2865933 RepID=A0ABR9X4K3_9RHOB|nr:LysE/ArgO family amino acid transporter [Salipiger mangrovisoli]MBE9638444.1 amino acid transporter [Salipiger mangrovisoli]
MQAAVAGFALGLSLIVAIGAQNAFVLRQGLRRDHVLPVVLVCALSDAVLIAAGVTGFGLLAAELPWLVTVMRWLGAAFLVCYGGRTLLAAWRGGEALHAETAPGNGSLRRALLTCLALTWLNPHVYLDTVMLLGAVSGQYDSRLAFGLGAATASVVFFFALGYGARLLAPVFARPRAWRVLDLVIGLTMLLIAAKLLLG